MRDQFPPLLGVDFSSRPTRRKPIVVAFGRRSGSSLRVSTLHTFDSLSGFGRWLADPANGPWLGAFDLPFGLPRELVEAFGWPTRWPELMRHYASLERSAIRALFSGFCAARPAGAKFAHRRCDRPAGSSPSMKWVNPPVAFMMHAGVPLLLDSGVHIPGLHEGDPDRTALEGYPGMLARDLIQRRSYKSDEAARQTKERRLARLDMLVALERGGGRCGLALQLDDEQRDLLLADASGDSLDAVLCLLQAGWAAGQPGYGLPPEIDPVEGWIIGAAGPAAGRNGAH